MKRRSIGLRRAWILFAAFLPGWTSLLLAADRPPNVVLIISDDQAWTDYSFMGHAHIRTPHLDRLAAQSLAFHHAYVPASLCRPSLASIITGLYPHQHKITSNDPPQPKRKTLGPALKDETFRAQRNEMIRYIDQVPTLPRLLATRGYLSHQSGKWWEGNHARGGFTHGMTHGNMDRGGRHGDQGLKIGREGMQPVFEFIAMAAKERKPFFVWYAPFLPHQPHTPPARLLDQYREKAPTLFVAKYWAMCAWFDETCGQLLDYLDRNALATNTLVIYVTDNGWIQKPDGGRYAPKSKQSPYDGGLRTPLLIRWPGRVQPRVSDLRVSSIDIAPTILTAAGVRPTAAMLGLDLLEESSLQKRTAIFGECFTHNAVDLDRPAANLRWRWIIEGDWKLIVPAPANERKAPVELYDLSKDPLEVTNLAEEKGDRVARLRAVLDRWWDGHAE